MLSSIFAAVRKGEIKLRERRGRKRREGNTTLFRRNSAFGLARKGSPEWRGKRKKGVVGLQKTWGGDFCEEGGLILTAREKGRSSTGGG